MPSTLSDPYLRAAFWGGVAAFVAVALVAVLIMVLRWRQSRELARWQGFVQAWRPLLLRAAVEPAVPTALPPLRGTDRLRFLRLWVYLHASLRGEAAERLNALARQLRLDRTTRRLLWSGSRAQRLLAILSAGHLADQPSLRPLRRLANGRDGLLAVNAAQALVQIDPDRAPALLLPLMLTRPDWDVARVAALLENASPTFGPLVTQSLARLPAAQLPRALQLARGFRVHLPPRVLAPLLQPGQPAAVLCEALPLAETPDLLPAVRACLRHPDARVRELATAQLGRLGSPGDVAPLLPQLQDASWPVRMAAARALDQLRLGPAELAALGRPGSPARDVIQHVLAERGAA